METDWRGRNVRIFPGWDVLRRAPFVEGHVVSLAPPCGLCATPTVSSGNGP